MTIEIPIWVSGKQLWITGVDKQTTVNDAVELLLGRQDKEYSIIEKWRHVERPLNGDTRILKLWKTWGDARNEVKLSLKKIFTENDSGRSSPTSSFSGRRKRRHKSSCKHGQTIHPRRLSQLSKTQNIEKLLKLILLQGETIQNQIIKLKDKDNQIEYLENEQHRSRIKSLGTNYVLETYLGSEVCDEKDSGVLTECTPSSEHNSTPTEDSKDEEITIDEDLESEIQDLEHKICMLEKITKVNKRIEKQEENLVRLYINIERCKTNDKLISDLSLSLEQLNDSYKQSEVELKNNFLALQEIESVLDSRKCYLNKLQKQINKSENFQIEIPFQKPETNFFNCEYSTEKQYCSLPSTITSTKPILDTLV